MMKDQTSAMNKTTMINQSSAIDQTAATDIFESKIHKYGKITSFGLCALFVFVPLAIQLSFGIKIDTAGTFLAFTAAIAAFGPAALTEFISYAPILGAGGQYLAFTTGNIMNMKMPIATSALKLSGIEPGTKEAEPITMIAIGVSSIVTSLILFFGLLLSAQMLPVLQSPQLSPAFDNIMPAILGAVAAPILTKNLKLSSVPCILAAILTTAVGYSTVSANQSYLLPVFLVIAIAWAYFLYRRSDKNKAAK